MSQKDKYRSFEEAANILKQQKGESELREEAKKVDRPISAPSRADMKKFLDYATDLLKAEKPEMVILIRLRYLGFSYKYIAKKLLGGRVKVEDVKDLEKQAIKRIKDKISQHKDNGVPILGG